MQTMQVSPPVLQPQPPQLLSGGGKEPGSGELMDPTPGQYKRWPEPAPSIKGRKPASRGSLH